MTFFGLDWDDEEEDVVRFQYNFLYGRSQFEEDRADYRETHQTHGWKSVRVGEGTYTLIYEGDDPAYEIPSPAERGGDWIYLLHAPDVSRVKIGYTSNPDSRISTLQTGSPVPLRLIKLIPGTKDDEAKLHYRFRDRRLDGEWFEDSILDDLARDV